MKNDKIKSPSILLCRISDLKQDGGFSIDAQKKYGLEYIHENNLELVVEPFCFIETASKSKKRTKFQEMLSKLKKLIQKSKVAIHLVVEKKDRLSRNFTSLEELQEFVLEGKLVIHYYKDKKIVDKNSTPADILFDDMNTAMAKYIALNIRGETKKGMLEKAQQGWFPSRPPTGYVNLKVNETDSFGKKKSIIGLDRRKGVAEAVIRIFELRATTELSYSDIAKQVKNEKIFPKEVRLSRTLCKSGVEGIIKNNFYEGFYDWQGHRCEGKHELFVPQHYIRNIRDRSINKSYKRKPSGVLSSFLTCSECGCQITYDPRKKHLRTQNKTVIYHYYHCTDGRRYHKENKQKQINLNQERILALLSKPVGEISITEELARTVSDALRKTHEKTITQHRKTMKMYQDMVIETENREDKLLQLLEDDTIDTEAYKNRIQSIRKDKRKYEGLLEETSVLVSTQFYETTEKIIELAKDAESLWKERNESEKVEFLKIILSNQTLNTSSGDKNHVTVEYDLKNPFKKLAEIKKASRETGFLTSSKKWCPDADLNHGHRDFQSLALPTELSGHDF
jgi:site-specific DNA recombinase